MIDPILVERYSGNQAMTIICHNCRAEKVITADDLQNDDLYGCPRRCGGWASHKYWEADHKCGGCGRLGFFDEVNNFCCSRRCMLQAEYAETLKQGAA